MLKLLSIDYESVGKFKKLLAWLPANLQPVLILLLIVGLWYQTRQLTAERELNTSLQKQAHDDNIQDKIFWRDAYVNLLKTVNEKDTTHFTTGSR